MAKRANDRVQRTVAGGGEVEQDRKQTTAVCALPGQAFQNLGKGGMTDVVMQMGAGKLKGRESCTSKNSKEGGKTDVDGC